MIFSLPFFIVAALLAETRGRQPMSRKEWVAVIFLGLIGHYLSSFLDFYGLQYISAGLERLILFLYPSFVVLINAMVLQTKNQSHTDLGAGSYLHGNRTGIYWRIKF